MPCGCKIFVYHYIGVIAEGVLSVIEIKRIKKSLQ